MSERKLATIRSVSKLLPIKGKDRIELAVVDGWSVIVRKGEFGVGSLGVFFEIDSFLPNTEPYTFLGKPTTHQGKQGYRIRTMKLAGCISQGLMLPLSMFTEYGSDVTPAPSIGTDLTELLGITKFDIDLANPSKSQTQVTGQAGGKFPSFIPKTDQERIQNLPHFFEMYKHTYFEETLKLDGSSCTMYKVRNNLTLWQKFTNFIGFTSHAEYHFGVCSRNLELKHPQPNDKQSNFWFVAGKYSIELDLPIGYAVQGEVLAPNIQGNYEKVHEPEYYIFNVYDIENKRYLPPADARLFVTNNLPSAQYVSFIDTIAIFAKCESFDELQTRVNSTSMNDNVISEGRVYKSIDGSVSFKCINNEYLLQKNK